MEMDEQNKTIVRRLLLRLSQAGAISRCTQMGRMLYRGAWLLSKTAGRN